MRREFVTPELPDRSACGPSFDHAVMVQHRDTVCGQPDVALNPVAPSFNASANASKVFSGACARAPRWANPIGGSRRDGSRCCTPRHDGSPVDSPSCSICRAARSSSSCSSRSSYSAPTGCPMRYVASCRPTTSSRRWKRLPVGDQVGVRRADARDPRDREHHPRRRRPDQAHGRSRSRERVTADANAAIAAEPVAGRARRQPSPSSPSPCHRAVTPSPVVEPVVGPPRPRRPLRRLRHVRRRATTTNGSVPGESLADTVGRRPHEYRRRRGRTCRHHDAVGAPR